MTPAPLFELDAVEVVIDGVVVLGGVSAALPATGITAVAGPSGAGKSTLLRLCNRLEVPTSGRVRFRGRDVSSMDPLELRRRVGMVFQRPALFGGTVRDNLRVARPGGDDERFVSALTAAGLDGSVLDRAASTLSGGEAQRACLARTLVTEPEVLLLDEPTSALDPQRAMAFERVAGELATAGMPMLWVTHDLAQLRRVASYVVAVVEGVVAFAGPVEDDATASALASLMALDGDLDAPG